MTLLGTIFVCAIILIACKFAYSINEPVGAVSAKVFDGQVRILLPAIISQIERDRSCLRQPFISGIKEGPLGKVYTLDNGCLNWPDYDSLVKKCGELLPDYSVYYDACPHLMSVTSEDYVDRFLVTLPIPGETCRDAVDIVEDIIQKREET